MTGAALLLLLAAGPDCGLAPGWKLDGARRAYVADTLFEYMNGNAEGYLIYGFTRLEGVTCVKGGAKVLIDVFEMANDEAAFGVFAANRDPREPAEAIGMAAQIGPRKAILAKGKHYVEFAAEGQGGSAEELRAMAVAMAARLEGSTALPAALGWFPTGGLDPNSFRLVPESVLGLRLLKRGFLAQYAFGKAFLVTEAGPKEAAALLEKLKARYPGAAGVEAGDGAFEAQDRYLGKLCMFRKGRHVGGFANVTGSESASKLAAGFAARIPND